MILFIDQLFFNVIIELELIREHFFHYNSVRNFVMEIRLDLLQTLVYRSGFFQKLDLEDLDHIRLLN